MATEGKDFRMSPFSLKCFAFARVKEAWYTNFEKDNVSNRPLNSFSTYYAFKRAVCARWKDVFSPLRCLGHSWAI